MGSITDYLSCGQCLKEFPLQQITLFIQHKKLDCDDDLDDRIEDPELQCNYCPQGFMTAWGLLIHAQISHNLKIFLERASKNLLKENKFNPVKPDIKTPAITYPGTESESSPPFTLTDAAKTSAVDMGIGVKSSSNLSSVSVLSTISRIAESTSSTAMLVEEPGFRPAKFGSNITVTKELSSKSSVTSVPNIDQLENISQVKVLNHPIGEGHEKLPPVKDGGKRISSTNSEAVTATEIPGKSSSTEAVEKMTTTSNSMTNSKNPDERAPVGALSSGSMLFAKKDIDENKAGESKAEGVKERTETEMSTDAVDMDESGGDESTECCDNQGCGITVIPGTHQDLQKCCNAVLPKKRKRHMEMKHMPFSWSSSRYARRRMYRSLSNIKPISSSNLVKQAASSIYIEVESEPPDKQSSSNNYNDFENQSAEGTEMSVDTSVSISPTSASGRQIQTLSSAEMKPRSLILKPGAVFSIPFTYTIPVTSTLSTLQINPSATMTTRVQNAPVLAATLGQKEFLSLPSQNDEAGNTQQSQASERGKNLKSSKLLDLSPKKYPSSKPFHCDLCPMAFNQRIHLKKHIMSKHTGNKPFKCGECDYSTVERSHLKVHIRIHTGEKPFKCTYCEYATAQNSTLKIHLKRHHGGKMFHCTSCEKNFTQERQLKEHECEHVGVISPEKKVITQAAVTTTSSAAQSGPAETVASSSTQSLKGDNSTAIESHSVGQITSLATTPPRQTLGKEDPNMVRQNHSPEK